MPTTSELARRNHESSGKADSHRELTLGLVRQYPGCTAVELFRRQRGLFEQLTRHEISRRLPELRKAGLVVNGEARRCSVAGTKQVTWNLPSPN